MGGFRGRGWRRALGRLAAVGVLGPLVGVSAGAVTAPMTVQAGSGTLTVEVNRDFSGDGVYDPVFDPPQPGIRVTVTEGVTTLPPQHTNALGQATFDLSLLSGTRFRVDVSIDDPDLDYLQPAPAAPATVPNAFRSTTTFVGTGPRRSTSECGTRPTTPSATRSCR